MSYIKNSLDPNEKIIAYEGMSFTERYLTVLGLILITIVTWFLGKVPFICSFFLLIYIFFWQLIAAWGFENAVTNQRVIIKRGIISRDVKELPLKRIETVELVQDIMGRIFGYGTVVVTGNGMTTMVIGLIDRPAEFRYAIAKQIS
jgi:uncharacterized membrane protein YdbT with pleckstrin-like domain